MIKIDLPWQFVQIGYTQSKESGFFLSDMECVLDQIEAMKKGLTI